MHDHTPGYRLCDLCGIQAPLDCEVCLATHIKNHHNRRMRRQKKGAR